MVSTRLLHQIEDHADQLAARVTRVVRAEPNLKAYHSLSDHELYDRVWDLCKHLGAWLVEKPEEKIRQRYEELGRQRRFEGIPLHEVVLALVLSKDQILEFARAEGPSETSLDLYGKEELEFRISRFFDRCIYYVVRGYEESLRKELRSSAPLRARAMYHTLNY